MKSGKIVIIDTDGNPVEISEGAFQTCPESHHTSFAQEYTADSGGDIASVALITPTAGKKLSIHVLHMTTNGASGTITLTLNGTDIAKLYPAKNTQVNQAMTHDEGDTDDKLFLSASGIGNGSKVFVKIQYIEED